MAMEIIIEPVLDQKDDMILSELVLDDELTGREKDSGHWSIDYTMQKNDKCDDEEEVVPTEDCTSSVSEGSLHSYGVNEGDVDTGKELQIIVAVPAGTDGVPSPPPLPPIGWSTYNKDTSRIVPTEVTVTISDPVGECTEVTPTKSEPEPVDDSKCCIVCFDPNIVTEYDDFDYDYYMDVHHVENSHITLPCCGRFLCKECMKGIISSVVDEGRVQISCPHPECDTPFTKDYVLSNAGSDSVKAKYNRFLVDVENDGKRKTCPKCCHITEHEVPKRFRLKESDLKIDCEVCHQEWCFKCHAPWHKDRSCRQFQKGSKDFKKWTKSKQRGVPNCQKCPTCFVYIQRSSGCHHMECNRCNTEFCYDCGNRFLELGIIDHDSTLNVWGCPDNYHKDEPLIRNTVRWGYLTAKLSYLAAYPPLLIGACGLIALGAVIVVPVYAGVKLYNYSQFKKANNRRRRRRQ